MPSQPRIDINQLYPLVRSLIAINMALDPRHPQSRKISHATLRELLLGLEEELRCALKKPNREDWL